MSSETPNPVEILPAEHWAQQVRIEHASWQRLQVLTRCARDKSPLKTTPNPATRIPQARRRRCHRASLRIAKFMGGRTTATQTPTPSTGALRRRKMRRAKSMLTENCNVT